MSCVTRRLDVLESRESTRFKPWARAYIRHAPAISWHGRVTLRFTADRSATSSSSVLHVISLATSRQRFQWKREPQLARVKIGRLFTRRIAAVRPLRYMHVPRRWGFGLGRSCTALIYMGERCLNPWADYISSHRVKSISLARRGRTYGSNVCSSVPLLLIFWISAYLPVLYVSSVIYEQRERRTGLLRWYCCEDSCSYL